MALDAGWDTLMPDRPSFAPKPTPPAHYGTGASRPSADLAADLDQAHLRCDGRGWPVHLTGGERHDLLGVGPLFERARIFAS